MSGLIHSSHQPREVAAVPPAELQRLAQCHIANKGEDLVQEVELLHWILYSFPAFFSVQ